MRRRHRRCTLVGMSLATSLQPAAPEHLTLLASNFELPLRTTDFEAGLASLLHQALNGAERGEVLAGRQDNGSMSTEAASVENGLWLELQRIPERWDDGLSSHGPAGAALRAQ